jgi:hypothetical protein
MNQDSEQNTSEQWLEHMLNGDFEKVWKLSDEGLKARAGKPDWHLPRHFQHIWQGESLNGKRVLVRCYHGLGDTIQFIRYVPLIKEIAREVIVWAQPELITLLKTVDGIDKLLPLHNGSPGVEYDVDIEIMECPHILRTTLPTIPDQVPYINVPARVLQLDKGQFAVGLVWKAGDWDSRRSVPFSMLRPLFNIPGVLIYILQGNAVSAGWEEGLGINPGDQELQDYAAMLKGLDLMISVDSMPVHLAGALGVPVWNLLHAEADWRWMKDRNDSPWYPTMRLFRQERSGEWGPVIDRVTAALSQPLSEISARSAGQSAF